MYVFVGVCPYGPIRPNAFHEWALINGSQTSSKTGALLLLLLVQEVGKEVVTEVRKEWGRKW